MNIIVHEQGEKLTVAETNINTANKDVHEGEKDLTDVKKIIIIIKKIIFKFVIAVSESSCHLCFLFRGFS